MKQLLPDLWQTEVERPAPGLTTQAYFLVRPQGNILFYNTSHAAEIEHMARLGGVQYQLLSHRDELGESLNLFHERFGTVLGGHAREREDFAQYRTPDILFSRRETFREAALKDIEVIPTPGHSPGSTCFLVTGAAGKRYLFTGDTLYLSRGDIWKPGLLPGSDKAALVDSLKVLQTLAPDAVFSSAFAGPRSYQLAPPDWHGHVETALASLL
ncbi:MBL fold metallo-hydrolase [Alcanivorax sp. JB21]|uniref:MBL fold metallo-hydrolase n=1 Tax=Alcanivorax limicola TaxID=2874102 RepID=UPI001CC07E1C|nr:MBL fold metallo-hydrolase [Alcanivorax limicola]MBZ2187742.1 MBL fold metallo-hydrolase [Alcanivorax limicola]